MIRKLDRLTHACFVPTSTLTQSALFAGVMIGMGQIISSVDDLSPGWEIVRILVYGSIIANLASAMCSLWVMGMCSDMPQRAQQLAIADPDSWPAKAAAQEDLTLPSDLFDNDYHLLRAFGMYQSYSTMEYWEIMWLIVGLVSMFSAITVWTWVAQSKVVAGVLLVFVIPALFFALYPIWRLIRETRREVRAAKLASNDSP